MPGGHILQDQRKGQEQKDMVCAKQDLLSSYLGAERGQGHEGLIGGGGPSNTCLQHGKMGIEAMMMKPSSSSL